MAKNYSRETRALARQFFCRGWTMEEIREELGIAHVRTIYHWRENERWDNAAPAGTVEETLARRICLLTERDNKSKGELAELDLLTKRLIDVQLASAKAKAILQAPATATATATDETGEPKAKKKRGPKNDISAITPEMLEAVRKRLFYPYQQLWWARKEDPATRRNRFILKSRQIGATFYFAWEALEDAIRSGHNQIFLSASRDQAEVFKAYIVAFAKQEFDIDLKGSPIILSNGAELRFLSTNSRTAQSYHGHLYVDEVFWIPRFREIWKLASGMSAHKKWRRTLFSTPSALSHEAYAMWSGEQYNRSKAERDRFDFDVSHDALAGGWLGPDRIWRHMVTVEDAQAQGCDLFDIDELRSEYSESDYRNLFLCEFIDDAESVFPLSLLLGCCVDPDTWTDYHPNAARPLGNKPVAIGYDPSRMRDGASLAILSVPLRPIDRWRVLARTQFVKQAFAFQASRIKECRDKFNLVHAGIDITGMGYGVYELVQHDVPQAMPITYSLQTKTALVAKGLEVMQSNRFEFDAGDRVLLQAFLMIRQTTSGTGQLTYVAGRSGETGHADPAWAVLHALHYEPIAAGVTASVTFSD